MYDPLQEPRPDVGWATESAGPDDGQQSSDAEGEVSARRAPRGLICILFLLPACYYKPKYGQQSSATLPDRSSLPVEINCPSCVRWRVSTLR